MGQILRHVEASWLVGFLWISVASSPLACPKNGKTGKTGRFPLAAPTLASLSLLRGYRRGQIFDSYPIRVFPGPKTIRRFNRYDAAYEHPKWWRNRKLIYHCICVFGQELIFLSFRGLQYTKAVSRLALKVTRWLGQSSVWWSDHAWSAYLHPGNLTWEFTYNESCHLSTISSSRFSICTRG